MFMHSFINKKTFLTQLIMSLFLLPNVLHGMQNRDPDFSQVINTLHMLGALVQYESLTSRETIESFKKRIYKSILSFNCEEALEYLEQLFANNIPIERREAIQEIIIQVEQFTIIAKYAKDHAIQYNRNFMPAAHMPIFELVIRMQQDGFVMAKNLIEGSDIAHLLNQENNGWLYYATMWHNKPLVEWLLEQANQQQIPIINMQNNNQETALDIAEDTAIGNPVIAQTLRKNRGLHGRTIHD
jgi:hypothetical protein